MSYTFQKHATRVGVKSENRTAWLRARRSGIGASDVAAIMGADDYGGPLTVYEEKVSEVPPIDLGSEAAAWGNIFEWPILTEYASRSNRSIRKGGELLQSKENPIWQTTLDAEQAANAAPSWAYGPGIAECKTVGYGGKAWGNELPARVQIQQQWQLLVTRAEWNTCVWLPFPERTLGWRDVEPHESFRELMIEETREFWRRVELRDPPAPNALDSARKAIAGLYPGVDAESVTLISPECRSEMMATVDPVWLAEETSRIKESMKALTARKRLIENLILATMKSSKWALVGNGQYWTQWQTQDRVETCPKCEAVIREVSGHRGIGLYGPSKAELPVPIEEVQIVLPETEDNELVQALEESLALTEGK
jgi:putative phage-type endonuclease